MRLESNNIRHMLDEALKAFAESKGEILARQIKPILLTNLDRGRVENFIQGDPGRIREYVHCVADGFSALHPYLHELQKEQSHTAWEPLYKRMLTWAYNYLLRKGFAGDQNTLDLATGCAADAAIILLDAHFPYDTEFDPWAHIIVQNACRKFMYRNQKKSMVPEDKKVELEDELIDPDTPLPEISALQQQSGEELSKAMDQLTEARRAVVHAIYFDDLSPEQIARRLDKTIGAVYTLHFHALEDLRKILSANRDNLNE